MSRKYMYMLIDIFNYHPACCAHVLSHTATRQQHHTLNHRLREFVCFIEVFNSLFEVRPGHGWRGQCLPNYRFSYYCDINENLFLNCRLRQSSLEADRQVICVFCTTSHLAFCELEHLNFDLGQTNRLSRLVTSWNVFALYAGRFVMSLLASMAIAKCEILATNKENDLRSGEKNRLLMQHDVSRRCESENNC